MIVTTTLDAYLAMWRESDPARRMRLIETAWDADGRYVDPLFDARGHAALSEMVSEAQRRFPAHDLRRVGDLDTHHDQVRFAWEVRTPDGALALAGVDVGALGSDGRLLQLAGFFDQPRRTAV
jgi:hypothetical protein